MREPGYRSHRNALLGGVSHRTMNFIFDRKPKKIVTSKNGVLHWPDGSLVQAGELEAGGYYTVNLTTNTVQEKTRARRRSR